MTKTEVLRELRCIAHSWPRAFDVPSSDEIAADPKAAAWAEHCDAIEQQYAAIVTACAWIEQGEIPHDD